MKWENRILTEYIQIQQQLDGKKKEKKIIRRRTAIDSTAFGI